MKLLDGIGLGKSEGWDGILTEGYGLGDVCV